MEIAALESAYSHSQTDVIIKAMEIDKLKADIQHLRNNGDTGAGRLGGLDSIVEGSKLKFAGISDGVVEGFLGNPTTGPDGDMVVRRIAVKHDKGVTSFHTYRHDGRSHHSSCHDIIEVINELEKVGE